ncbi:MAG: hypothetical protein H6719_31355 [Sandaracinaceae bacterium]|nr:hypothetical protein [Sandaracinaceae bacterium]
MHARSRPFGPRRSCARRYNRGLVAPALDDVDTAQDAFEASLELRPNSVVEHRWLELGGRTSEPGSTSRSCEGAEPEVETSEPEPPLVRRLTLPEGAGPLVLSTSEGAPYEYMIPDGSHTFEELLEDRELPRLELADDARLAEDDEDEDE